jgi:transcriptional regulator with GAF, ATPase, and Fis domain
MEMPYRNSDRRHVVPLRERSEDSSLSVGEFLQRFAVQAGKSNLTFSPEASRASKYRFWPGNIRELQNRMKRA